MAEQTLLAAQQAAWAAQSAAEATWWALFVNGLAAAAAIGAAAWAVLTWRAGQQDRRRREAAVLSAIAHTVGLAAHGIRGRLTSISAGENGHREFTLLRQVKVLERCLKTLEKVSPTELPSAAAVDIYGASISAVEGAILHLDTAFEGEWLPDKEAWLIKALSERLSALDSYEASLKVEASRIEHSGGGSAA